MLIKYNYFIENIIINIRLKFVEIKKIIKFKKTLVIVIN